MKTYTCPEHELALLGALKIDNLAMDEIRLSPGDFYEPKNREIYQAIRRIIDTGRAADDLAITDELRGGGAVDAAYVSSLPARSSANITFYAEKIREAAQKRRLYTLGLKLQERAGDADPDDLMNEVEKTLTAMSDEEAADMLWLADLLYPTMQEIEKRKGGLSGVPTGFKKLDVATNGFQAGDLIIVGARASIGKTALALTMARAAAGRGFLVGFFSCEMSRTQLACRLLAAESNMNLLYVNSGNVGKQGYADLNNACDRLYESRIMIDDMANPPLTHIRSGARRMKRLGIQIIFVDYLTLIQHGPIQMSRPERVGQISKSLKQLARELDVPIVAMSQLNRDAEGKVPNLAELRQSGEIEEDSDIVLLLHRNRETDEGVKTQNAEIIIAKHRNGPLGHFSCTFCIKPAKFAEESWEYEGEEDG